MEDGQQGEETADGEQEEKVEPGEQADQEQQGEGSDAEPGQEGGEAKLEEEGNDQAAADVEEAVDGTEQAAEQQDTADIPQVSYFLIVATSCRVELFKVKVIVYAPLCPSQSDTFADGEKAESPAPHVGEILSREGSPRPVEMQDGTFTPPRAETPREEHTEEMFDVNDLEAEIMSPEQDREGLVEMYHVSLDLQHL